MKISQLQNQIEAKYDSLEQQFNCKIQTVDDKISNVGRIIGPYNCAFGSFFEYVHALVNWQKETDERLDGFWKWQT
jgi:hypothetical protein